MGTGRGGHRPPLPLRRLGEPDDIAKAALFLVRTPASWITGDTLVVDGGALAMPSGGVGSTESGQVGPADLAARCPGQLGDHLDLLGRRPRRHLGGHQLSELVRGSGA